MSAETPPTGPARDGGNGDWQAANEHHLAASLAWLRLVLSQQAGTALELPVPAMAALPAPPRRRRWWLFGSREHGAQEPTTPRKALPAVSSVTGDEIAAAAADRSQAAGASLPPALETLADRFGLSDFERDVVLLCAAMDLDPGTAARCARAHGDPALAFPTFALALQVLPGAAWDALSPQGRLRHWQLVEITPVQGQPLITSPLRADERIVNYIKGLNDLDERIDVLVTAAPETGAAGDELPPTLERAVTDVLARWRSAPPGGAAPVIQLLGPDGRAKLDVAVRVAAAVNRALLRLPVESLPAQPSELETLARLWHRESVLLPIALYLDAQELDGDADARALARFVNRSDGAFLVATRDLRGGIERPTAPIDVDRPRATEQRDVWTRSLGPSAPPRLADALGGQFDLAPSAIREIVAAASADTPIAADADTAQRLWDGCVASTRVRLDHLAQRIEPRAGWEDIVLPEPEMALLRQIADQVAFRTRVYEDWGFADRMSRGLGISVLFAGPSGTGKTLAAEVLARHLRLGLYRIDLSAVVSKYIGETEKNLRQVFDAAESGSAILFFDEADALFGKRSEVKDAHDRYANIEVNYLLQRMESYRGLAILATNMRSALDQAFVRRLRFVVTFKFPAVEERRAIWEHVFPAGAQVTALDYDRLARLPMTGAMVQNVALNAAFVAARRGTPVSMAAIFDATRTEFGKLELPVPETELALPPAPARPQVEAKV